MEEILKEIHENFCDDNYCFDQLGTQKKYNKE